MSQSFVTGIITWVTIRSVTKTELGVFIASSNPGFFFLAQREMLLSHGLPQIKKYN